MFTEIQTNKIIEQWGKDVYSRILREIEIYSQKWRLSDLIFFESYSMNAIFFCESEIYGECVLKIGSNFQDAEFVWEYNVLHEYNGRRFVKVLEKDIDIEAGKKVMLLERVSPGTTLNNEDSLDKRLYVFSELFNGMHIEPKNISLYKKYSDGINDNIDYISNRDDCKELYCHTKNAKDICMCVSSVYNKEMLLHGDLNYHNILLGDGGRYTIIDPQGRIGAFVFDISRYMLVEYYNSPADERIDRMNYIFEYFEGSLNVSNEILRQCFYIEACSFECWCASVGEYDINNVIFADTMMKR